ncbi:hypothetical protein [Salinimicrobium gaetbulicola]|uniref:Uncharacterized protein n=1 Tax=Salinimicrobium gaetbulicola TaxID=999702 RepID=A0ABW3ICW5_9FLAO
MMLERTNLHERLKSLRKKEISEEELLQGIKDFINAEAETEQQILDRIQQGDALDIDRNDFNIDLLEPDRIFHISQIKKICIQYRLRFLNTKYFKGELPPGAIFAIKELEKKHSTTLRGFSIIAPAEYFRLENADDPMLFSPIGNNYYYLIHKWGQDIHPLRKVLMWPLKNLETLIIFSFFASILLTFGIREIFFSRYQATSEFLILFLYTFKSTIALIFFYGISLGKNFSSGNWNSKFYNA